MAGLLRLLSICSGQLLGSWAQEHYWPRARGHPGSYGVSKFPGPKNLSAELAWQWIHPSVAIVVGSLMDSERNIYVIAMDGIRKFSLEGQELWFHPEYYPNSIPSLQGEFMYGATFDARLFKLELATGKEVWQAKMAGGMEMDCPYVEYVDGLVLAAFDKLPDAIIGFPGNRRVVAANATDGKLVWEYLSDTVLWNFLPVFVGDGSFLTMDVHGSLRRLRAADGKELSYTTTQEEGAMVSFTDGGVTLGPGGKWAYSCSNLGLAQPQSPGILRAYKVTESSVELAWSQVLAEPCVTWPASDGDIVVVASGALPAVMPFWIDERWLPRFALPFVHFLFEVLLEQQHPFFMLGSRPLQILAFDAATGAPRWRYEDIPAWNSFTAAGDGLLIFERQATWPIRPVCGPAAWSMVTLGSDGRAYVSGMNGVLYALKDEDGDGKIAAGEVSQLDVGHASLHAAGSFGKGATAFASCHGLSVFRTE